MTENGSTQARRKATKIGVVALHLGGHFQTVRTRRLVQEVRKQFVELRS